jgi:hypothetical protein
LEKQNMTGKLGIRALLVVGLCAGLVRGDTPTATLGSSPCRGEPPGVACYARPSDTGHYIGYRVGGGCLCLGDSPRPGDGAWGWDYRGCIIRKYVALRWCHCGHYQGGSGAYRTVGPTNLPSRSTP